MTEITRLFLERVRSTIESGWTKGALAKDKLGAEVDCTSARACTWCLEGAIYKNNTTQDSVSHTRRFLDPFLPKEFQRRGLFHFNDANGVDKASVLKVLDKAIASLPVD